MSDNTPFQSDPTQIIASDDVSGIKFQRVKLNIGADGVATDLQPPDADAKAATTILSGAVALWNGASFDRQRGNVDGTAIASAPFTTTQISADILNYSGVGVQVILDVTVVPGVAPSLVLTVEGKDPASNKYYAVNANPTAVIAVGTTVYAVYPGVGAASGGVTQRTSGSVPRTFRIKVTAGNANSATYSVGYSLLI